jgi:hypothetical protein
VPAPAAVRRVWTTQVAAEYASSARAAELAHWLLVLAVSPDTILRAGRVVTDELTHADLSREVLELAGGTPSAAEDADGSPVMVAISANELWIPDDPDEPLELRALAAAARLFGCGESTAEAVFAELLRHTREPRVVEVLERLLRDEHFHRVFGWDLLDELLERTGDRGRAFLRTRTRSYVELITAAYRWAPAPCPPERAHWGLMPPERYGEVVDACVRTRIVPGFERLGVWTG